MKRIGCLLLTGMLSVFTLSFAADIQTESAVQALYARAYNGSLSKADWTAASCLLNDVRPTARYHAVMLLGRSGEREEGVGNKVATIHALFNLVAKENDARVSELAFKFLLTTSSDFYPGQGFNALVSRLAYAAPGEQLTLLKKLLFRLLDVCDAPSDKSIKLLLEIMNNNSLNNAIRIVAISLLRKTGKLDTITLSNYDGPSSLPYLHAVKALEAKASGPIILNLIGNGCIKTTKQRDIAFLTLCRHINNKKTSLDMVRHLVIIATREKQSIDDRKIAVKLLTRIVKKSLKYADFALLGLTSIAEKPFVGLRSVIEKGLGNGNIFTIPSYVQPIFSNLCEAFGRTTNKWKRQELIEVLLLISQRKNVVLPHDMATVFASYIKANPTVPLYEVTSHMPVRQTPPYISPGAGQTSGAQVYISVTPGDS